MEKPCHRFSYYPLKIKSISVENGTLSISGLQNESETQDKMLVLSSEQPLTEKVHVNIEQVTNIKNNPIYAHYAKMSRAIFVTVFSYSLLNIAKNKRLTS